MIPATLILAGPCYITQIKTKEKDGYEAVQLGFMKIEKKKKIKKSQKASPYRYLKEFRLAPDRLKVGDLVDVSLFKEKERVTVSAMSKGKGFAGAVKRWGFKDRAKAHGAKDMRKVGAVGGRFPQRVIKGKKMPGRMGGRRITVKNLEIVKVVPQEHLLVIKGGLPGRKGSLLEIRSDRSE